MSIEALNPAQCRAVVAMCCSVARADGEVSPSELEALLDILSRFAAGVVGFSELARWLEEGPPPVATRLPGQSARAFVHEALTVAHADGKVDEAELRTIKALVARYFDAEGVG